MNSSKLNKKGRDNHDLLAHLPLTGKLDMNRSLDFQSGPQDIPQKPKKVRTNVLSPRTYLETA